MRPRPWDLAVDSYEQVAGTARCGTEVFAIGE
jgi:hypothetical protein